MTGNTAMDCSLEETGVLIMKTEDELEEQEISDEDSVASDIHYCDPDARIVLITRDRVALRVDAWHMSRQSDFIKGLLAIPSSQTIETAPIYLDHNHEVVRSFLDIIYVSSSTTVQVDISQSVDLLALSDMLGTSAVERFLLKELRLEFDPKYKPRLDAWTAFKIGASRGDIGLAKAAIRCFELSGHTVRGLLTSESLSIFDGIPPRYVYALMRASFDPLVCTDHTAQIKASKDSKHPRDAVHVRSVDQIADLFKLD